MKLSTRISRPLRPLLPLLAFCLSACSISTHPVRSTPTGQPVSLAAMEAAMAQPQTSAVQLQTIHSADWEVPLSGLLNLDHAAARQAGLQDKPEPIQVDLHVLVHPRYGAYLIDTGVSRAVLAQPEQAGFNRLLRSQMGLEKMHVRQSTAEVLQQLPSPLQGVFLTHLHLDHIMGLKDLPLNLSLYTGKGEAGSRHWLHMFIQPAVDAQLQGRPDLQEWPFAAQSDALFPGIVDVFGDASVFAISVPGHTPGSTAYLVRSSSGNVLITGDACHTRWGWEHGVEPGSYTRDHDSNLRYLLALKALAQRHPDLQVRLGHQ